MRNYLVWLLIALEASAALLQPAAVSAAAQIVPIPYEEGEAVDIQSPAAALLKGTENEINRASLIVDHRDKVKIDKRDQQILSDWLRISDALKRNPKAYAEYKKQNNRVPDRILNQLGIKRDKLVNLDTRLVDTLRVLFTDQTLTVEGAPGAGHEYVNISHLINQNLGNKRKFTKEGAIKPEFEEVIKSIVSAHHNGMAADISGLDYIRCTKVSYKSKSKNIVKREKQKPVPIEFLWQAEAASRGPYSNRPDGALTPNSQRGVFGTSPDKNFRKAGTDAVASFIAEVLGDAGFNIDSQKILSLGNTPLTINDIVDLAGQAIFRDTNSPGSYGEVLQFIQGLDPQLRGSGGVDATLRATGARILSPAYPNIPSDIIGGTSLDAMGELAVRRKVGEALVAPGYAIDDRAYASGDGPDGSSANIIANLGAEYLTDMFHLPARPHIREVGSDPKTALGILALVDRLGLPLEPLKQSDIRTALGALFDQTFTPNPALIDIRLGVRDLHQRDSSQFRDQPTQRYINGELSQAQYLNHVSQAVINDALDAYAADADVRSRAFGLSIDFGPEDFLIPTYTTIYYQQVAEIEKFYGPLLSTEDLTIFHKYYKYLLRFPNLAQITNTTPVVIPSIDLTNPVITNPGIDPNTTLPFVPGNTAGAGAFPDQAVPKAGANLPADYVALNTEKEIREWLAVHARQTPDYIGALLNGTMTNDTWQSIGRVAIARMDPQPMNQLALTHYLATGEMWTLPLDGTTAYQAPVMDIDLIASQKLGLLAGDFDRIFRGNQFQATIIPRLKYDIFAEASKTTQNVGYIAGMNIPPQFTEDFLTGQLDKLKNRLANVTVQGASSPVLADLRNFVTNLGPGDWHETSSDSRALRIGNILNTIGSQYATILRDLPADARGELDRLVGGLVAGRDIPELSTLKPPTINDDRALGLTASVISSLYAGHKSPDDLIRELGANFLSNYVFDDEDPVKFARDLQTLAKNPTAQNILNFTRRYDEALQTLAGNFTSTLGSLAGEGLTASELMRVLTGNRIPLFRNAGALIHEGATGLPGSILTMAAQEFADRVGLRQLLGEMGLRGGFFPGDNLSQLIPKQIFEQFTGIRLGNDALSTLRLNGPELFRMLGAPAGFMQRVESLWNINRPEQLVAALADPQFWRDFNLDASFADIFGGPEAQMAASFISIFTNNANPDVVIRQVANQVASFIPQLEGIDVGRLVVGIQNGDSGAIRGVLSQVASQYLDPRIVGLANILTTPNASPRAIVSYAIPTALSFLNSPDAPQIASLANNLTNYFVGGQKNPEALFAAALDVAMLLDIPYAADIAKIASDPVAFGQAMLAKQMQTYVNEKLPQPPPVTYDEMRKSAMGPDAKDIREGALQEKNANPAAFDQKSPQAKDQAVKQKAGDKYLDAAKQMGYSMLDAQMGAPRGFTKAMLEGNNDQKIQAFFQGAEQWLNLPPGSGQLASAIASFAQGDKNALANLENSAYAFADAQLSQLAGIPLPKDFTKTISDYAQGNINGEQLQAKFQDFAVAQVSALLDDKLGLPPGTSYTLYDTAMKFQAASQIADQAARAAAMANIAAGLVSFIVTTIFAKQLAGIDNALGLPPGTASMLVSMGITYLMTGLVAIGPVGWVIMAVMFIAHIFGLFGSKKEQILTETVCSPGGYYPYIPPGSSEAGDASRAFDPNPDLDHYRPIKDRLPPNQVEETLRLWPGYPGEFLGKESNPRDFELGKKASARWKIRALTGELLSMCQRFGKTGSARVNEAMRPNQIILYKLADREITSGPGHEGDGDYLSFYKSESDRNTDRRFYRTNKDGVKIGILDYPLAQCGYGTGKAGSMVERAKKFKGIINQVVWTEDAQAYRHHIHFGY